MGYQVYWEGGRWCGYGVPAYCDFPGCDQEIDRGVSYKCEREWGYRYFDSDTGEELFEDEIYDPTRDVIEQEYQYYTDCGGFFCGTHESHSDHDMFMEHPPEHPVWLRHILTNATWREWRRENPSLVKRYRQELRKHNDSDQG